MINSFTDEYAFLSNACQINILIPTDQVIIFTTSGVIFPKDKFSKESVQLGVSWEEIRTDAMHKHLIKRFEDPILRDRLMETKDEDIVYGNYAHDNFWGKCQCSNCEDVIGKNHLGNLLMKIRESFLTE